jgi:hypothetical protein
LSRLPCPNFLLLLLLLRQYVPHNPMPPIDPTAKRIAIQRLSLPISSHWLGTMPYLLACPCSPPLIQIATQ